MTRVEAELEQQVVGREQELSRLASFLDGSGPPRALVIEGGSGAGKTTVWEAAIRQARLRGLRVLSARPSGAEAGLSFAVLTDLLVDVDLARLERVPAPQRHALDVAMLRAEPDATRPGARAIATGLVNVLRELAGSLVVAVDDVQWLDRPSAEALAFAARRLDDARVRFLLARRSGPVSSVEAALGEGCERLRPAPLSLGATRALLLLRLGSSVPRRVLRQLHESAGGNPLFALELGRMLAERGTPAIGEDMPVPDMVEELVGVRIASLPRAQRRLLLALALSPDLGAAQLEELRDADTCEQMVEDGLLLVEGGRVRPSHPLLAAAAATRSRARERRDLHLELSALVTTDALRGRHLALATVRPDAALAATIAAAAEGAAARGAREEAVELAEHALRLTPPDEPSRSGRVLALAAHLETAGEQQRMTDLLDSELESIPPGAERARAWLLLSEGSNVSNLDEYMRCLDRALAEARHDPALQARVVAKMSSAVVGVERIEVAERAALEVLEDARRAGPDVERPVLFALAWPRGLRGLPVDDVCERWAAAAPSPGYLAEAATASPASGSSGGGRSSRRRRSSPGCSGWRTSAASRARTPGRASTSARSRSTSGSARPRDSSS